MEVDVSVVGGVAARLEGDVAEHLSADWEEDVLGGQNRQLQ